MFKMVLTIGVLWFLFACAIAIVKDITLPQVVKSFPMIIMALLAAAFTVGTLTAIVYIF